VAVLAIREEEWSISNRELKDFFRTPAGYAVEVEVGISNRELKDVSRSAIEATIRKGLHLK